MKYRNNFDTQKYDNQNTDVELNFKRHNIFFDEVENNINEIRRIGEIAMFEPKSLNLYFSKLYMLIVFYSAYFELEKEVFWVGDIEDIENRKFKLESIKKKLFGKKYIKDIENINILKIDEKIKLNDIQQKIFNDLNSIARELSMQMSYGEIRPKPQKKKEEFSEVENKVIKEIMRGYNGVVNR